MIGETVLLTVVSTLLLLLIPNNSNFPSQYIIPLIVAGLVKYILGDWDAEYQWSKLDLLYWGTILGTSYLTINIVSKKDNSSLEF